jgi:hypothetical protein
LTKKIGQLKYLPLGVLLRGMLSDWEIKTRSHRCARTNAPFQDGAYIYTLLFREHNGFRREDISEEAWLEINDASSLFSFWKARYEAPPPRAPEAMPKESTEELLRRLIHDDRPDQVNARYVLAVMLERKKVLKQMDVRETLDEKLLIYERAKSGEVFIIADPGLRLDQLDAVQQELFDLLTPR